MAINYDFREGRIVLTDQPLHVGDHGTLKIRITEVHFKPHLVAGWIGRKPVRLALEALKLA
jgi:hypothetical protein